MSEEVFSILKLLKLQQDTKKFTDHKNILNFIQNGDVMHKLSSLARTAFVLLICKFIAEKFNSLISVKKLMLRSILKLKH